MNWENVVGFQKREFAPDGKYPKWPWDMDPDLIMTLVYIRSNAVKISPVPVRIVIHKNGGFVLDGHSETSLHGQYLWDPLDGKLYSPEETMIGRAADFTIEEKIGSSWVPWSWLKQAAFVFPMISPCNGLGIYPWWNRPGLHLDYRGDVPNRLPAVWFRSPSGEYFNRPPERFHEILDGILDYM